MRAMMVAVCALLALLVAPWLGPALDGETASFVLWQLRLPRAATGALVGLSLSLVGSVFQVVFDNPLVAPSTLGTTAGASLGALAVFVLFPSMGTLAAGAGAAAGAMLVTATLAGFAAQRRLSMADLLLVGIAISLASSALGLGLQVQADAASTLRAVRWSLGSLSVVGWSVPSALAPVVLLCGTVLLAQTRALQTLAASADQAEAQGVDVVLLRWRCLGASSLLVGAVVAASGPIAFVGLLVPHCVRLLVGGAPRHLLPLSAVLGAGLLPLCDGIARVMLPGRDLPVGVITAGLGAPALVALLLARTKR